MDKVGGDLYELDMNDDRSKDQDWDRVYDEADRRIELLLKSGVTVIDDQFDEIVQVRQSPTADEAALIFHHDDDIARWLQRNSRALDDRP